MQWILKNKYLVLLFGVLLLSIILRFYNYDNRWGLAADQARDVLVARQAWKLHKLPLIGPFSASGPFIFGPYWYWLLMIPVGLFYNILLAPWIFLSCLYVMSVLIMYFLGKKLVNVPFGILLSLLAAISPSEIQLSTNLIMSALTEFLSVCIFYFFISYIKKKKLTDLSFMALFIGIAVNTHFETVPLLILLPIVVIFGKRSLSHMCALIGFSILPFVPLFIFNFQSHSYESTHIFLTNVSQQQYSLIKNIFEIIKRELIFLLITLPRVWERTIIGFQSFLVDCVIFIFFLVSFLILYVKRIIKAEFGILLTTSICIVLIIGYYSGRLFANFLSPIYPLILIFTAWICYLIFKWNKYLGVLIIGVFLVFGIYSDVKLIYQSTNTEAKIGHLVENALIKLYPNKKFTVFNYTSQDKDRGLTISLFLDVDGKISDKGVRIGIAHTGLPINYQILYEGPTDTGLRVYDLTGIPDDVLIKQGFIPCDSDAIYSSVENWYKR